VAGGVGVLVEVLGHGYVERGGAFRRDAAQLLPQGELHQRSSNRTGRPAATTADEAEQMLGDAISVLLDAGPTPGPVASTIVDCTDPNRGRVLRLGVLGVDQLDAVVAPLGASIVDEG
jgi:hypothetical protein